MKQCNMCNSMFDIKEEDSDLHGLCKKCLISVVKETVRITQNRKKKIPMTHDDIDPNVLKQFKRLHPNIWGENPIEQ